MKITNILVHAGITCGTLLVVLGLPFSQTAYGKKMFQKGTDAVSTASVILDSPSGNFLVFLNRSFHEDPAIQEEWKAFFSGEEISYIFEDLSCSAAKSDAAGIELARSYQSRLPENQMTVKEEDSTLLLSRMDAGKYDVVVMSTEFAEQLGDLKEYQTQALVIPYHSEKSEEQT